MMQKNLKSIIIFTVGVIVGIYSLLIIKKITNLSLESKISFQINPIEIISITINLLLALYIAQVLSKRNEQEKSQKELLINYLKEFQSDFSKKTDKLLEMQEFDVPTTNLFFKYLRSKIYSIISIAKETNLITNKNNTANSITQKVTEIWTYFTDTPKKISSKANLATREGLEALRLEKISKIESSCIELDKLIYQLAIDINKK